MTAAGVRRLDAAARDRTLRALGVMPLALRGSRRTPAATPARPPIAAVESAPAAGDERIVLLLLLPAGSAADARQQALLRAAVACLPAALQRAPWLEVDAAVPPPRARAYLAFGQEALQTLGRALSAAEQQAACVIGVEAPALLLAEPARKRSLWRALKTLRRSLEEAD
ncbi:MAG: hypothetical protein KGJ91_12010 [Xanthomonadaceae bacterium]|nr:hypothetical protein [Xanthomonadaceae bacterium]